MSFPPPGDLPDPGIELTSLMSSAGRNHLIKENVFSLEIVFCVVTSYELELKIKKYIRIKNIKINVEEPLFLNLG